MYVSPLSKQALEFEMAYYADIHHKNPLAVNQVREPYRKPRKGAIKTYASSWTDILRDVGGEIAGSVTDVFEEFTGRPSKIAKGVFKLLLNDLSAYYENESQRNLTQQRLIDKLELYKNHVIILLSHSMGTIIAYDVLRKLGRDSSRNDITVEHFVTFGSPLGIALVKGNIIKQFGERLRTPSIVTQSWQNFADGGDIVALDTRFADDFYCNSYGVKVVDQRVANDYPDNPHKSYGYLRTPEMAEHLVKLI